MTNDAGRHHYDAHKFILVVAILFLNMPRPRFKGRIPHIREGLLGLDVLVAHMLNPQCSWEDAGSAHRLIKIRGDLLGRTIAIRDLHFLIGMLIAHSVIAVHLHFDIHAYISTVAKEGGPTSVRETAIQVLSLVEIDTFLQQVVSLPLIFIAGCYQPSFSLVPIGQHCICSFHFNAVVVIVPHGLTIVFVGERP